MTNFVLAGEEMRSEKRQRALLIFLWATCGTDTLQADVNWQGR